MKYFKVVPLFLALLACSNTSKASQSLSGIKIAGIPGPEDLALDTSVNPPRIIVSSDSRRAPKRNGEIFAINPKTKQTQILPRKNDPQKTFHPHGISLVRLTNGTTRLYVIVHHERGKHSVAVYQVQKEKLLFLTNLRSPLLTSPNDLYALPDGTFYLANDRSKNGGFLELALALKKSTLVFYNGLNWNIAADKFAMANSVAVLDKQVFVSQTTGNAITRFDIVSPGILSNRQKLCVIPGADNLSLHSNLMTVASHPNFFAFMQHAKDSSNPSPSVIYQINPTDGSKKILFQNNGKEISAASVGLIYDHTLWIGQVFDDFVEAIPLK